MGGVSLSARKGLIRDKKLEKERMTRCEETRQEAKAHGNGGERASSSLFLSEDWGLGTGDWGLDCGVCLKLD